MPRSGGAGRTSRWCVNAGQRRVCNVNGLGRDALVDHESADGHFLPRQCPFLDFRVLFVEVSDEARAVVAAVALRGEYEPEDGGYGGISGKCMVEYELSAGKLGELAALEEDLEGRPNDGRGCFCAVHSVCAERETGADGLIDVDHWRET